jgi:hypothetical protein
MPTGVIGISTCCSGCWLLSLAWMASNMQSPSSSAVVPRSVVGAHAAAAASAAGCSAAACKAAMLLVHWQQQHQQQWLLLLPQLWAAEKTAWTVPARSSACATAVGCLALVMQEHTQCRASNCASSTTVFCVRLHYCVLPCQPACCLSGSVQLHLL